VDPIPFRANKESEARLLLLIDAFTQANLSLQGRVKLAKLDFLLRYPQFYRRALRAKGRKIKEEGDVSENNIEGRMVRYRYGPWDPAYYALLGSLLGRGLIETVPEGRYTGLRTTPVGQRVAASLSETPAWEQTAQHAKKLRAAFSTTTGTTIMKFIYENFPEVSQATWGEKL